MAYQVTRFNGTFLVSVADGTIDSSTDLRFVGKNYAGYGQVQNENFLYLLENFAGSVEPGKPVAGQIWYDSALKKIKVYDGSKFKIVGGATSGATAPSGLVAGEFWFDSVAQQLYCWTGAEYTLIGPVNPATLGETSLTSQVVKDSTGTNRTIAKIQAGGTVVAIFSKDAFTLNSSLNPIAGFTNIKKGYNLVDTDVNGLTSLSSGAIIWGTASSANNLVDTDGTLYPVSQLVKTSAPSFSSTVNFGDSGFTLGTQNNLSVGLENSSDVVFSNQSGNNIKFNIRISNNDIRSVANLTPISILPGANSYFSLGSSTLRWSQVFADYLTGNLTGNVTGNLTGNSTGVHTGPVIGAVTGNVTGNVTGDVFGNANTATTARKLNESEADATASASTIALRDASGNLVANRFTGTTDKADRIRIDNSAVDTDTFYRSAKTTKTANTIAARDPAGNLSANIFNGTATAVQGADLAEKYLADKDYEVGTVMIVGGEQEVTASIWVGQRAVGVVSSAPGLMMNQDLEDGTYIALKGRVPVRVIGQVRKGDRLIAAPDGCAIASEDTNANTFAIALETNVNTDIKTIEAIVL